MIDTDDLLIKVLRRKRLYEIHKTIRLRRRRQQRYGPQRCPVETAGGNLIIDKRLLGDRISQLDRLLQRVRRIGSTQHRREVAVQIRCCWNVSRSRRGDIMKDGSLIPEEEERLVGALIKLRYPPRATDRPTELVALNVVATRRLPVPCVEDIVPHKLEDAAVKLVRPGFRDYIDHRARVLSILRAEVAGLHTKLLQRVWHRKGLIHIGVLVYIVSAIQLIIRPRLRAAVGRDGHRRGLAAHLLVAKGRRLERTV